MNLNEYQQRAAITAVYKDRLEPRLWLPYTALGLAGEAGEFANVIKKMYRDGDSVTLRRSAAYELGDAQWYVALAAEELGLTLDEVADLNIQKLKGRHNNLF